MTFMCASLKEGDNSRRIYWKITDDGIERVDNNFHLNSRKFISWDDLVETYERNLPSFVNCEYYIMTEEELILDMI
jgi:hypothetical protein